jgi:hypothetical protein
MPSVVFYNKERHIIEQTYEGDQNEQTVTEGAARLQKIIDQFDRQKEPVNVVLNITNVGMVSRDGQEATVKVLKELPFDKMAVYGANTYLNGLATIIIAATGKSDKIKVFGSKMEAEMWLTQME